MLNSGFISAQVKTAHFCFSFLLLMLWSGFIYMLAVPLHATEALEGRGEEV
jgi:hypothetical protein